MPVFLDDQPVAPAGPDLASVLQAAGGRLGGTGRMVVEVRWDGRTLNGGEIAEYRSRPVADVEVRLYSADAAELSRSTLRTLQSVLDQAQAQFRDAAKAFQADQAVEGGKLLAASLEVWNQLPQAVIHSAALLGLDLDAVAPDGVPMQQRTQDLVAQLRNLRDALERNDTVALADILAYEWTEVAARWDALLDALVERVESLARRR